MAEEGSGNAFQAAFSRPIINMISERIERAQEQRVVALHVGQQSRVGPDHVNFCFDEVGMLRVTAQRQEGEPQHILYLDPEEKINYLCIKTTRAVRAFMIVQAERSQSSRRIRNNSSCPERTVSCSSLQFATTKNRTLLVCGRYSSHYDTALATWIDLRELPELSLTGCMIVKGKIYSCTLIERLHDTHFLTRHTLTFEPLQLEQHNEQNNVLGG